jgi:hypothetical protein
MNGDFSLLISSAIGISMIHTLTGPDHYLPFVALSKSGKWTIQKTFFWTILCGFAHVLSSILIGLIGILIGWSLLKLNVIESTRGTWASWMLLIFGVFYTLWGLYDLKRNKLHKHFEVDDQAEIYVYEHRNGESVLPNQKFKVTPWVMFFIFALGPSEPLIPLLFYPTVEQSFYQVVVLVIIYTAITILMMLLMVTLGYYGVQRFSFPSLEKFMGLLSGLVILICGVGMVFLNW